MALAMWLIPPIVAFVTVRVSVANVKSASSVSNPAVVANGTRPEVSADEVSAPVETLVGVMAPSVSVICGVVVASATDPEMPFAVTTDTLVTLPRPGPDAVSQ